MGKVALSIVIPLLLVAAWWLGTQSSQTPVATPTPTQAAPQPSPSGQPAASPSASQQPAVSATPEAQTKWRPDYSQASRPAPSPSVAPSPSPTPEAFVQKQSYPATDLHWFIPSDAEMAPFGFSIVANRSEDNRTGIFLNISEYYAADEKVQQFGEGFSGMFSAVCLFSNGTRDSVPCSIQVVAYDSPSLAAAKVSYNQTPEVTGLGSAGMGEKSVLYRVDRATEPKGTFYKVKFSRKNVFVNLELSAIRGDGSKLDALAIALLIDGKI
jgi:hypothetical protein